MVQPLDVNKFYWYKVRMTAEFFFSNRGSVNAVKLLTNPLENTALFA